MCQRIGWPPLISARSAMLDMAFIKQRKMFRFQI
jgi:hypothetical protein